MTLALAHGHAAPTFNGLFYATVATIIPVLFLALAVQGRTYGDLVKSTRAISEQLTRTPFRWSLRRLVLARLFRAVVLVSAASAIIVAGSEAEILAITNLYVQRSITNSGPFIFLGVTFLIVAAAAGPAVTIVLALADAAEPPKPEPGREASKAPHDSGPGPAVLGEQSEAAG
jgi:hypothetical protein